jgi:hypothetical protein
MEDDDALDDPNDTEGPLLAQRPSKATAVWAEAAAVSPSTSSGSKNVGSENEGAQGRNGSTVDARDSSTDARTSESSSSFSSDVFWSLSTILSTPMALAMPGIAGLSFTGNANMDTRDRGYSR